VRAKQKHEHIAGGHSRQMGLEVFVPRIRFRRKRRSGAMWVTEPLFPGYFFARLDLTEILAISSLPGVAGLVHFGENYPVVPDTVIEELSAAVGSEICEVPDEMEPGDEVQIIGGSFDGIMAVVKAVLPKQERVEVLMGFLGSVATVRLSPDQVAKEADPRRRLGFH
jgi:transcriptional antiterminator RfaH